jgi:hypothetical protein
VTTLRARWRAVTLTDRQRPIMHVPVIETAYSIYLFHRDTYHRIYLLLPPINKNQKYYKYNSIAIID